MRKSKKAYAKINLCLNVSKRQENGFHDLESVVVTVDLYDKITLVSRKDKKVTLKVTGSNKDYIYECVPEKDNAYKAALAYMSATGSNGVDVFLEKNIPTSSGMGGSSSCASATLVCMEELYGMGADLTALANSLGSDTAYLLKGGWALLKGRGDNVEFLDCNRQLKIVAVYPEGGVNTAKCFEVFDKLCETESVDNSDIGALIRSLNGEELAFSELKNALLKSACTINPNVKSAVDFLTSLSPSAVFLTGSGSTVCAIFDYDGLNDWAVSKCKQAGFDAEVLKTVIPKK